MERKKNIREILDLREDNQPGKKRQRQRESGGEKEREREELWLLKASAVSHPGNYRCIHLGRECFLDESSLSFRGGFRSGIPSSGFVGLMSWSLGRV